MAPLVRRTWAPRGQTPILRQRTRARDKVSMIATLTISPRRRRIGLYAALVVNANVNAERLVEYLRALLRHLRGPLILIWDRLNVHRAALVRALLRRHPRLLHHSHVLSIKGNSYRLRERAIAPTRSPEPQPVPAA